MDTPGDVKPFLPDFWSVYTVGEDDVEMRSPGRSVRLSGSRLGALLPGLLPVLDGRHTTGEICEAAPDRAPEEIECLIARLVAGGLLSERGRPVELEDDGSGIAGFLRSLASPSDEDRLRARVEGATVCLWGSDRMSAAVLQMLRGCGVRVVAFPRNGRDGLQEEATGVCDEADLLVGCGAGMRDASLERLNAISLATGTPWLPVASDASEITLGPLVVPGRSACLVCLRVRAEALSSGPMRLIRVGSRPVLPAVVAVASGIAAVEALKALLGVDRPALEDAVIRLHVRTLSWTRADVLRLPRCPACASARPFRREAPVQCTPRL